MTLIDQACFCNEQRPSNPLNLPRQPKKTMKPGTNMIS